MRVAIIEDEPISANELIILVKQYDENIIIDPVLDTIEHTIDYLKNNQPDLLLLDIELADGNSFEIFNHISVQCPIIFTTAYNQYALKAFEQNSISYLLKPITFDKLEIAFEKISTMKTILKSDINIMMAESSTFKENFLVRSGKKLMPVNVSQIAYFYSEDNICFIVLNKSEKYLFGNNLHELEDVLDPKIFFRINRQFIVSRDIISHLESYVKGQVKLHFKEEINAPVVISRQKTSLLKSWLS
jgi:DNA-binding LytR/AlgR family response regulator